MLALLAREDRRQRGRDAVCEDCSNGDCWVTHRLVINEVSICGRAGDSAPAETPDLTPESVNAALDEVRPYLIADGGNVEVASISDGVVYLRLQVCKDV